MYLFDEDMLVSPQTPTLFAAVVSGNWSINGIPNGGYLMALLTHAMLQKADKKSTPIITGNFVSRCTPGEASVSVEKIAGSNQFERFQARLFQEGKERIRAIGTFAQEKLECFLRKYEAVPPDIAPVNECIQVPELPAYSLMSQVDIRLDPRCAGWMSGNLSEKSQQMGWIAFKDGRPFDALSILLAADAFPPAVMASQGFLSWVPTIEFSVNLREPPSPGWLRCVFRSRFITCGMLEEDGEV
ncbi:MAG: thioesterase family protein, partial [Desulfomonilia bacterium]|nr:thioesterase family protein [Desulfomonilia bacterium]